MPSKVRMCSSLEQHMDRPNEGPCKFGFRALAHAHSPSPARHSLCSGGHQAAVLHAQAIPAPGGASGETESEGFMREVATTIATALNCPHVVKGMKM
jgi:hypothetical protein